MTKKPAKAPNRGNAKRHIAPKKPTEMAVANPYAPAPNERASMDALIAEAKETPFPPRIKVTKNDGVARFEVDHPNQAVGFALIMNALGTTDPSFLDGLLVQLANAGTHGRNVEEREFNFMLSLVIGVEPRDQVEAMLAAQMAAVHNATMTFARRLAHVENIPQQDSAERAFNKLARTFASQVEALKRYRTGGEQKVTVEHVHVHQGGQAIVGNVAHDSGGGRAGKNSKATP